MLADLAGVVHDRQSSDYEHRHGEDDLVFIATSPLRAPTLTDPDFSWFKMNPP
jgi:hypothetical protein